MNAARRKSAGWPARLSEFDTLATALRARTGRPLSNAYAVLPKGTLGRVVAGSSWGRLEFIADGCETCGVRLRVNRLDVHDVELLDAEGLPIR